MERIGEKFKEKKQGKSVILIGILFLTAFIAIIWLFYVICQNENCCKQLCILISLCILFLSSIILLWEVYRKEAELKEKQDEFNRKIDWEEFQHNLYRQERNEKLNYDRLIDIINKLESKKEPKDNKIKELEDELKRLRDDRKSNIIIEVNKNINPKTENDNA